MIRFLAPLIVAALVLTYLPRPLSSQEAADSVDNYAFDLDTQSAHYSFWRLVTLRHHRLRARLVVGELRRDKRWAPGVALLLRNGEQVAFLRIWAPDRKPPLIIVLERHGGAGRADSVVFSRRIARDDTFHVDLDWS